VTRLWWRCAAWCAALAVVAGAARAQESPEITPPSDWVRQPVDASHAQLAPNAKTVGKWSPLRLAAGDPTALYFAVGDSGGATLDAYAKKVFAAIPHGAANVRLSNTSACNGGTARAIAYDLPARNQRVDEAVAVGNPATIVAAYVRPLGSADDPHALAALGTICPQSVTG
jgi:hypothetical protein